MKILLVTHEYPPIGGGGATACRQLAADFAAKGHRVTVVTAGFGDLKGEETTAEGAGIVRLPAKRRYADHCGFAEMLDFLCRAVRFARKKEKRDRDDVCLCFFGIPSGPAGLYLKKRFGIPYAVRIGGGDIPGFQKRFKVLYKLTAPPLRLIWKEASALVTNSGGLKELATAFCSRYPVTVIPNGVDTEVFCPPAGRPEHEEVRLLSVCRLIERKGLQDVIAALPELEKETGKRLAFTIVGDGPYRGTLEELCREKGVSDRVVFTGTVDREEIPAYYRDSDVFCCPSYKEGMPNTVLEAMASGLPVIMRADCQGAAELVTDNGLLAEGLFGDALKAFLELPREERLAMGEAGRRRAVEEFSRGKMADSYEKLFREALDPEAEGRV